MKPSRELRVLTLGLMRDLNEVAEATSMSEDAVLIGTDAAEFVVGGRQARALLRTQMQEVEAVGKYSFEPVAVHAFEEGAFGWSASEFTFTIDGRPVAQFRITMVFAREGSEWRIIHFHGSNPRPNEEVIGIRLTTSIDAIAHLVESERPDLSRAASPEGTLTIMFTDMEASTATNEALGDDWFLPLLLQHNEIVEEHTRAVGGSVVKSQGDGFMLAFPSARKAVECAMCVQRAVTELSQQLRVRMGLHTGEPVRHADDFYGRDVAYAARLGSAATGGEILVSSLVKALVEPSGSVRFDGPRELELKGFDGPQPVYAVSGEIQRACRRGSSSRRAVARGLR